MELKLKNGLLVPLVNWLSGLMLHGAESRQRTRFIKLLAERMSELEPERLALCEKYAAKKDGKTVYINRDGKETYEKSPEGKFKIDNLEGFNKEYADYMNEELILDITPATRDIIYGVRDILLNTNQEFNDQQAAQYNEWAEAFEAIKVPLKLNNITK